jgi:hypothetical protein
MVYKKYFDNRWKKLTTINKIRLYKLLEISQYIILYLLISIPVSVLIEEIFPDVDESKPIWKIMIEIIAQMVIMGILIFYLMKIVKLVPFIFMSDKSYIEHKIFEYEGTITISLVMLGTQKNLVSKIHIIRKRIMDVI